MLRLFLLLAPLAYRGVAQWDPSVDRESGFECVRRNGQQCPTDGLCPFSMNNPVFVTMTPTLDTCCMYSNKYACCPVVPGGGAWSTTASVLANITSDACCRRNVERLCCAVACSPLGRNATVMPQMLNYTTYLLTETASALYNSCKDDCFLKEFTDFAPTMDEWVKRLHRKVSTYWETISMQVYLEIGYAPDDGGGFRLALEASCASSKTDCACYANKDVPPDSYCDEFDTTAASCCRNDIGFAWPNRSAFDSSQTNCVRNIKRVQCHCLCPLSGDNCTRTGINGTTCVLRRDEALHLQSLCQAASSEASGSLQQFLSAISGTCEDENQTLSFEFDLTRGLHGIVVAGRDICDAFQTQSSGKSNTVAIAVGIAVPLGVLAIVAGIAAVAVILRKKRLHKVERLWVFFGEIPDKNAKGIHVHKTGFSFGEADGTLDVKKEYKDILKVTNLTAEPIRFACEVAPSHKYQFVFDPASGEMAPGATQDFAVCVTMLCTTTVSIQPKISFNGSTAKASFPCDLKSGLSYFLDWDDIKTGEKLGQGAVGTVFRATWKSLDVALKCYRMAEILPESQEEYIHESRVLTSLHHPNIITLYGISELPHMTLVMEYAPFGSLSHLLEQAMPMKLKTRIALDCASGIAFLHQNNILHRDLKPDNLLIFAMSPIASVVAKLTDFGSSRLGIDKATHNYTKGIGTPNYMAPEILNNKPYSVKADVFSFSVVIWELFTQVPAYADFKVVWDIAKFITDGQRLPLPSGPQYPPTLAPFIASCWDQEPAARPDFQKNVATCLEMHAWAMNEPDSTPAAVTAAVAPAAPVKPSEAAPGTADVPSQSVQ